MTTLEALFLWIFVVVLAAPMIYRNRLAMAAAIISITLIAMYAITQATWP